MEPESVSELTVTPIGVVKTERQYFSEENPVNSSATQNDLLEPFPFANRCLICAKDLSKRVNKYTVNNKDRVIRASKDSHIQITALLLRNRTPEYELILKRIKGVDLVAVNAAWHKMCRMKLAKPTKRGVRGRPEDPVVKAAMNKIFTYIEESSQEAFTIQELLNVIKDIRRIDARTLKKHLLDKYGDRFTFIATNNSSYLVSRNSDLGDLGMKSVMARHRKMAGQCPLKRRKDTGASSVMMINGDDDVTDAGQTGDKYDNLQEEEREQREIKEKDLTAQSKMTVGTKTEQFTLYCSFCLARDRTVQELGEYEDMYKKICWDIHLKTCPKLMVICWECRALLRNAKRLYERAHRAHEVMSQVASQVTPFKSLSSLSVCPVAKFKTCYIPTPAKPSNTSKIKTCKFGTTEKRNISKKFRRKHSRNVKESKSWNVCNDNDENNDNDKDNNNDNGEKYVIEKVLYDEREQTQNQIDSFNDGQDRLNNSFRECDDMYSRDDETDYRSDEKDYRYDKNGYRGDENDYRDGKTDRRKDNKRGRLAKRSLVKPLLLEKETSNKKQKRDPKKSRPEQIVKGKQFIEVVQEFNVDEKIIVEPIERGDVEYWLEKERNSTYFRIQSSKCERCVCGVPGGEDHHKLYHSPLNPFLCEVCSRTFGSERELACHSSRHYYTRRCALCGFRCYTEEHIRDHIQHLHRTVILCTQCGAQFRNVTIFKEHYKEIHEHCICDYCGKRCSNKFTMARHIQYQHLKTHKCDKCNKIYKSANNLWAHNNIKHSINRTESAYCVQCDKQFDNRFVYRQHVYYSKRHAGEQKKPALKLSPVQCPQCEKTYANQYSLTAHYSLVHEKRVTYQCRDCNKAFPRKSSFKIHMLRAHEGYKAPKDKVCDICGRGFSTNRILTHHIRTHTGERPHACPHCDAKFAQKAAMTSHVKNIHKKKLTVTPLV